MISISVKVLTLVMVLDVTRAIVLTDIVRVMVFAVMWC